MARTANQSDDSLNAEQLYSLDQQSLRLATANGIPEKIRALTWSKLLEIECSLANQQQLESLFAGDNNISTSLPDSFNHYYKPIHREVERYCKQRQSIFTELTIQKQLEFCISSYLSNHTAKEFTPALVPLCGPFVYVYKHELLAYLAFSKLLDMIDEWLSIYSLEQQILNFMVLLRVLQPELLSHFEEEEIDTKRLVSSWFETLLGKQLPIDTILLFWDQYFSSGGLKLHVYTCLAILQYYKEDLEELEQSEIESFFFQLPQSLKVEPILVLANQISFQIESLNIGSF